MVLATNRLVLRPWQETDAADLYFYAKDERIGPIAGWPAHKNEEESLSIIKNIFMRDEIYAVTLKKENQAIGLIGLSFSHESNFPIGENDAEVSYWIGVPFWGKGLIPESINAIMHHAFTNLKLDNYGVVTFKVTNNLKLPKKNAASNTMQLLNHNLLN